LAECLLALLLARGKGHGVTVTFRCVVTGTKQTESSFAVPLTFGHQYSIFCDVTVSVIVKNSISYEHVSDSGRPATEIQLFELARTVLPTLLSCVTILPAGSQSEVDKRNADTPGGGVLLPVGNARIS
jgi:hypothetical protein